MKEVAEHGYIPLKAETENGEVIIEPSEDAIFGLIVELAYPDNTFVIVEPAEDAPEWFASVALADGGDYEVEYRDMLHRYHRLNTETDPDAIAFEVTAWTASTSRAHDARRRALRSPLVSLPANGMMVSPRQQVPLGCPRF